MAKNFSTNHPELDKGEIFLINATEESYDKMMWTTRRKGKIAYDRFGADLSHAPFFPVFVQRWELERNGIIRPEKLWEWE